MGSRIPKGAQRAIDKANRQRQLMAVAKVESIASVPPPRLMALGITPRNIMNMHDVFFNGEKQTLCVLADVEKGTIIRWDRGKNNRPAPDAKQEQLYGKVEIRRK